MPERKIIHIDMDAFFASVEQRDSPYDEHDPQLIIPFPEFINYAKRPDNY